MSMAKKIIAPILAASMALSVAHPVEAVAQGLTHAEIYQPTTSATVKDLSTTAKEIRFSVNNKTNNADLKKVRLETGVNADGTVNEELQIASPYPIAVSSDPKTGKPTVALKGERIYPASFQARYFLEIEYRDGSKEHIPGLLTIEPVQGLIKESQTPASPQGNIGRIIGIVFGVLAGLGIVAGIGVLLMNAMPGAPKPP